MKWAAEGDGGSTRFRVATKKRSLDKEDHLGDGCRWFSPLLSIEAIMTRAGLVLGLWAMGYVIFLLLADGGSGLLACFGGRFFSGRG